MNHLLNLLNISRVTQDFTEIYFAPQNSEISEKIKKLFLAFFQGLFSFDMTLTLTKVRRRWTKLFEKESNKEILKLSRVVLNQEKKPVTNDHRLKMQAQLSERGILLNCINPPEQKQLNDLNTSDVQEYLAYLQTHHPNQYQLAKSFWETGVDKITVKELEDYLGACTEHLELQLEQDYDIGFVPKKSSKWIAELAMSYLSKVPAHGFTHSTDTGGVKQSKLADKSCQFVIFDDASYSGKQLLTIINCLQSQLAEQGKKGKLFLVVPFVSSVAEEFLIAKLAQQLKAAEGSEACKNAKRLKVHLITSTRKVKTMRDLFPGADNQSVSFMEWKIPDTISLSTDVRGATVKIAPDQYKRFNFLTDYPPCYKEK